MIYDPSEMEEITDVRSCFPPSLGFVLPSFAMSAALTAVPTSPTIASENETMMPRVGRLKLKGPKFVVSYRPYKTLMSM